MSRISINSTVGIIHMYVYSNCMCVPLRVGTCSCVCADLPFVRPGAGLSLSAFKILQQQQHLCSLARVKRKSREFGVPADFTSIPKASRGGFTKSSGSALGKRVSEAAGMACNYQPHPGKGKASRTRSPSTSGDWVIKSFASGTLQVVSVWEPSKAVQKVADRKSSSGHQDGTQKELTVPQAPNDSRSTSADPRTRVLPLDKLYTPCSYSPASQESQTGNRTLSAQQTLPVGPRSDLRSLPASVGHSRHQQKGCMYNQSATNAAAPSVSTSTSPVEKKGRKSLSSGSELKTIAADSHATSQNATKPNLGVRSSLITARTDSAPSLSTQPPFAAAMDGHTSAKRQESTEVGEINSPESGEVFSPDQRHSPCLEDTGLEPGEIVSPFLELSPEPGEICSPRGARKSPDIESMFAHNRGKDADNRDHRTFEAPYRPAELQGAPIYRHTQERIPQTQHHHTHGWNTAQQKSSRRKRNWSPPSHRRLPSRRSRSPPRRYSRRHYSPPPERRARSRSPPSSRHSRLPSRESSGRDFRPRRGPRQHRRSVGDCASEDETELLELRKEALLSMIHRTGEREEEKKEATPTRSVVTPLSDMSECSMLSDTILLGKPPVLAPNTLPLDVDNFQALRLKEAALEAIASSLLSACSATHSMQQAPARSFNDTSLAPIANSLPDVQSTRDSKNESDKTDVCEEATEVAAPKDIEDLAPKLIVASDKVEVKPKAPSDAVVSDVLVPPARALTYPLATGQRLSLLKQEGSKSGGSSRSGSPLPQGSRRGSSAVQVSVGHEEVFSGSQAHKE